MSGTWMVLLNLSMKAQGVQTPKQFSTRYILLSQMELVKHSVHGHVCLKSVGS